MANKSDQGKSSKSPSVANDARSKTTKAGRTRTVSRDKPATEQRTKRAKAVVSKTETRANAARRSSADEKGLADLLEHALRDMYYAERKIYRSLPKMIKAADNDELANALTEHREETEGHVQALEAAFAAMGLRAKGEKCDAIDGILEEAEGILEDFGGTLAGDAAIIFSARAVEHYEISRYSSIVGFADALGLDEVHNLLSAVLEQEKAAEETLVTMAEGSINEAASEYDEEESSAKEDGESFSADSNSRSSKASTSPSQSAKSSKKS